MFFRLEKIRKSKTEFVLNTPKAIHMWELMRKMQKKVDDITILFYGGNKSSIYPDIIESPYSWFRTV